MQGKSRSQQTEIFATFVLFFAGIILIGYSIFVFRQNPPADVAHKYEIMDTGSYSDGVIVKLDNSIVQTDSSVSSSSRKSVEVASVQYLVNKNTYEVRVSRNFSAVDKWFEGKIVQVVYAKDNPQDAVVNERGVEGTENRILRPLIFFVSGILSLGIGLILSIKYNRNS